MVRLACVLSSDLTAPFSVNIAEDCSVDELKVAITKRKSRAIQCDSDILTLYLGIREKKWLTQKEVRDEHIELSQFTVLSSPLLRLRAVGLGEAHICEVSDEESLKGASPIHVIVGVPDSSEQPPDSKRIERGIQETIRPFVDELKAVIRVEARKAIDGERGMYLISRCPSAKVDELKYALGLATTFLNIEEEQDDSVPGFGWTDASVTDPFKRTKLMGYRSPHDIREHKKYMVYIKSHLKESFFQVQEPTGAPIYRLEDTAEDKDLLTTIKDDKMHFNVHGTADMMVAEEWLAKSSRICPAARFIIEVKKDITEMNRARYCNQVVLEMILVELQPYVSLAPVGLLTDLNKVWYFFWFTPAKEIAVLSLQCPANAFRFMNDILSDRTKSTQEGMYQIVSTLLGDAHYSQHQRLGDLLDYFSIPHLYAVNT